MSKAKLGRVPQIPTADMEDDPIFTAVREYQQAGPGEYSATRIAGLQHLQRLEEGVCISLGGGRGGR